MLCYSSTLILSVQLSLQTTSHTNSERCQSSRCVLPSEAKTASLKIIIFRKSKRYADTTYDERPNCFPRVLKSAACFLKHKPLACFIFNARKTTKLVYYNVRKQRLLLNCVVSILLNSKPKGSAVYWCGYGSSETAQRLHSHSNLLRFGLVFWLIFRSYCVFTDRVECSKLTHPLVAPNRGRSLISTIASSVLLCRRRTSDCLVHFARLANTLLKDGESARDNHVLACNFCQIFTVIFFTHRLSN